MNKYLIYVDMFCVTEGECGMVVGSWYYMKCTVILAAVYVFRIIMHLNMLPVLLYFGIPQNGKLRN